MTVAEIGVDLLSRVQADHSVYRVKRKKVL